ncbi:MAG TPA: TIGR03435 family protein, partial [Bryobacteraceae bacterium]|nr:TIGR03435 family protein [Bryobacteraceae bacterium]
AGVALGAVAGSLVYAQSAAAPKSAEAKAEFEVATIKPSAPPGNGPIRIGSRGGPGSGDPGRVTYSFSRIRDLMVDAYNVKFYQISGGPDWLDSERFDIVAKIPEGTTKEQARVMLQNLLADRFKLTIHRETKELPMYALTVGPKGPKLKETTVQDPPPSDPAMPAAGRGDGPPPPRPGGRGGLKLGADGCPETPPMAAGRRGNFMMITPNGACFISNAETMAGLVTQLSNQFGKAVVDQTGLTGKYDFKLRFDPSSIPRGSGGGGFGPIMIKDGPPVGAGPAGDPANRVAPDSGVDPPPTIFAALQEQLGLKLEAKKGPVEMLVIDHVEKTPTEN